MRGRKCSKDKERKQERQSKRSHQKKFPHPPKVPTKQSSHRKNSHQNFLVGTFFGGNYWGEPPFAWDEPKQIQTMSPRFDLYKGGLVLKQHMRKAQVRRATQDNPLRPKLIRYRSVTRKSPTTCGSSSNCYEGVPNPVRALVLLKAQVRQRHSVGGASPPTAQW